MFQHLTDLWVCFVGAQDLFRFLNKTNHYCNGRDSFRWYVWTYKNKLWTCSHAPTSFTKCWQKAGAIHSRAWIPQSVHIIFFGSVLFRLICIAHKHTLFRNSVLKVLRVATIKHMMLPGIMSLKLVRCEHLWL